MSALTYAARTLRRSLGFSLAAVIVLAIATGANTAIFSVVEGVLLRPLPYKDPSQLCVLWKSIRKRGIDWDYTSAPTIADWRAQTKTFRDIALVLRPEASRLTLQTNETPIALQGSIVSSNFFELLGERPALGHVFKHGDAEANVVVLSDGFWKNQFGGRVDAIGKTLIVDRRSVTIVGVMPADFQYPSQDVKLWLPLAADPRWPLFQMPRYRIADAFMALARLKSEVSRRQAAAELSAVSIRLAKEHPETDKDLDVKVVALSDQIAGPQLRRALWTLSAAAFCVLLLACSNIASLIIARSTARAKELSIRIALGAGQARLTWQLTAESLLLSLAGTISGILLARAGLPVLLALAPTSLPRSNNISINWTVIFLSALFCLITIVLCGLLPTWLSMHREGAVRRNASFLRPLLVAVQFSLAIMLLAASGLFLRSFVLLNAVDRGFDTRKLLTAELPGRNEAFFNELIDGVRALPGVQAIATGDAVLGPFRGNAPNQSIIVEGQTGDSQPSLHGRNIVSESYFQTLGIPLLRGRLFTRNDTAASIPVAVINKTMARMYWGSVEPIGKRFKQVLQGMNADWLIVIGVVNDAIYNRDGIVVPVFYLPAPQFNTNTRQLVVRTAGDPKTMVSALRKTIQGLDPALPQVQIATVDQRLAEEDRPVYFQATLIGTFAVLAIILAATGLYGLMTYAVEQRTREIGIRMALGDTRFGIVSLVLEQAAVCSGLGMVAGTVGAIVFERGLASSLYKVTPSDPATLAAVIATLSIAVTLAAVIPALRAAKVDPIAALRHD